MIYWPHQERMHQQNRQLAVQGRKSWVNCSPCGSGKTAMMLRIVMGCVDRGSRIAIYSCRVANTQQVMDACKSAGIKYGVVAAEHSAAYDPEALVQICQLQTVASRLGNYRHDFPVAQYVIVDEAHQQTGAQAQAVFDTHFKTGCKALIGFTATPVNCGGLYEAIINDVTYQELLDCKSHLPAIHYGPDRPDMASARTGGNGEFTTKTNEMLNPVQHVFGRIMENYRILNPFQLPAILFGASVKHSCGHAYEFMKAGIPSAHIDGERVLITRRTGSGRLGMMEYETTSDLRAEVFGLSKEGEIKVICNRFVLREAVDMPWLYQAIIACSMGGLSTYLQSVGRVLRYWPEYEHVIVQDHGGNVDRHGLCNEEGRVWELGDDDKSMHAKIKKSRQETPGDGNEPICCPKCNGMRTHGTQCPYCGHMHTRSVRLVRQTDGKLVRKVGRLEKYKATKNFDDYLRQSLYQFAHTYGTVKQAYQVAVHKARAAGVREIKPVKMWVPPAGDPRWNRSSRDVYRNIRPKGSKE